MSLTEIAKRIVVAESRALKERSPYDWQRTQKGAFEPEFNTPLLVPDMNLDLDYDEYVAVTRGTGNKGNSLTFKELLDLIKDHPEDLKDIPAQEVKAVTNKLEAFYAAGLGGRSIIRLDSTDPIFGKPTLPLTHYTVRFLDALDEPVPVKRPQTKTDKIVSVAAPYIVHFIGELIP